MSLPLEQHRREVERNLRAWEAKPLLRAIYAGFYQRIQAALDRSIPGPIVELGSGIGNLKQHIPEAIATDLFPQPWLDQVCDAYALPFAAGGVSNLVLFDVFHHLERPNAFLGEARRVLAPGGRVVLFEPYISWASWPVYGWLHPEPIGWRRPISDAEVSPPAAAYYAAQGNATRLFFRAPRPHWLARWEVTEASAFSAFHYLLSGGYSRPACYPAQWLGGLQGLDRFLSRWPALFAARCLVVLRRPGSTP